MDKIKYLYRRLVRNGYLESARLVLHLSHTGSMYISDGNDEAYESGMVDYLTRWFNYSNSKYGFTVYFKR